MARRKLAGLISGATLARVAATLGIAALGLPRASYGHERWANGDPLPAWVKSQCCGPADAHRLEPEQVHEVSGGFMIDGYPDMIPYGKLLPSQDGDWWVFYRELAPGSFSSVYCFFGPMSF